MGSSAFAGGSVRHSAYSRRARRGVSAIGLTAKGAPVPTPDMSKAEREALAHRIARDREDGLSGNALRAKYGQWLTGPNRRVLLRAIGRDDLIAPSYVTYRDGQPRKGSLHARKHRS
jgi:hypothetical protein